MQFIVGKSARSKGRPWLLCGGLLLALGAIAQPAAAHLLDEFTRSDTDAIGNQWIEKNPAAFAVAGSQVIKNAVGTGYRDNIVYRPSNEDVLDVEAAVEVTFNAVPPGYAQVLVRVQSATVASFDTLDAYILYVNDSSTQMVLGRQNGNAFVTTLATLSLTQALNTTDRFRLRLAAVGTNPVLVSGYVERLSGASWEIIGQAIVADSSPQRIATPGSVGFGGYVESSYRFDNFVRVDLAATGTPNPLPVTWTIAPAAASAGSSDLTLTVYGSGFTTDSVVRWNGNSRATTYVSPSELEAQITAADLATAGARPVTVFNPTPGGGVSNAQTFQVTATALPTLEQLTPASASAGDAGFTLAVSGENFDGTSVVRWNGASRPTTFVSPEQLTATISAADIENAGTVTVTVERQSDGAVTNGRTFTIVPRPATPDFLDMFNGSDAADLGNGWIEKSPSAFSLAGNEVAKVSGGGNDYRNNVVYRPAGEDVLDVEASVEFRLTALPPGYPQVMVRAQSATIGAVDTLDAYMLYVADSTTQAVLARQRGNGWNTPLALITISPPLNTTDRYRLRLRATGTDPVQLTAFVERLVGTSWQLSGQASFSDTSPARIATPGSVGFSGYVETNYRYDNFARSNLGTSTPNPVPSTSGLSPTSAPAGSNSIQLTVNGAGFVVGSVVRWNGADRLTTYVSPTQLTAQIALADLAVQGTATVTVFNPAPGGGTSNAQTFTITAPASNPVPAVTALSPSSTVAGSAAFTLTVTGSGFVPSSTVRWNGSARTTTYVSANELRATINAADVTTAGTAQVTVFSPAPGGGTSAPLTFTITSINPAPTTTGLSPASVPAGSAGFTLTVLGNNFVNGSTVRLNGADRATTYVSATELRAAIPAADVASTGTRTITVFTPAPGGGSSNGQTLTVTSPQGSNPVPVLTELSPTSRAPNASAFTLTVRGSGFTNQSEVLWNGAARPTTYVSSTELRASISGGDLVTAGLATVTVLTPPPGGGMSTPLTFFVQDGSIGYFFDGFNRADSAAVGPGWTEKTPVAFALANGEIVSTETNEDFMQSIVYRPLAEDRLDVEVGIELRRLPNVPFVNSANFPQLHARVQRDTVQEFNTLTSYIFFIDDIAASPRAIFAISDSQAPGFRYECYISALPLPQPLVTGDRYRLRMRVVGTNPVQLWGSVEQFSNGAWITMASGTATHDSQTQPTPGLYCDGNFMPPPIGTPGSVGFSKWWNRTDVYDNFYWRDVDAADLPPTLTSIEPSSIPAGTPGAAVTLTGARFTAGSVVRWNGADRPTTFISPTELSVTLTAADLARSGSGWLSVLDPETGLASNALALTILPGSPVQTLADDFARGDGPNIGNNWIEKTPAAFSLAAGLARKDETPGGDYRNNLVYRPSGEAWLNSEASMELRLTALPVGYPMLVVRLQPTTAGQDGGFDGYLLYMSDSTTQATLSRQRSFGGYDTPLASFNLTQPLQIGGVYRLRLAAIGTQPVQLSAAVERLSNGVWETIGQATVDDTSADRIAAPGVVGFGGDVEGSYSFDAFRRIDYMQ